MKKTFLTGTISIFCLFAYAQTNTFPSIGNAGVGTTSPTALLHLYQNGASNTLQLQLNAGGGGNWAINPFIIGTSNGGLSFVDQNNATTPFVISTTDNIGIGTVHPGYKLEVAGGIGTRGQMGNGSTGQYFEVLPYEIATDNNAGRAGTMIGVRSGGMNNLSVPLTENVSANAPQYQQAWAMTFGTDKYQTNGAAFSLWTGDATTAGTPMAEIFRIKSNGYVGIGTTNPDQKLTVNGTIHAKQVNVDVNVPVPDYVFEKNYPLKPLAEVKKYVDANKHLPEIPAAAVMEKNGINVTELNIQLLKKIEELTLYLIDKDAKDKKLQNLTRSQQTQLVEQQKEINSLKQQMKLIIKK